MKLAFLSILTLVFAGQKESSIDNETSQDTSAKTLVPDVLEKISGLVDDKTAFALSHTTSFFRIKTQDRINHFKFQTLKENCPSQFNYLTKNGNAIIGNSFKPTLKTFEYLENYDKNEEVLRMLHQRRLCIQSMLQAKDLIADRLDKISIALPPDFMSHRKGVYNYLGHDADVEISIEKYYASIKLLVETGLVKEIQIHSAFTSDYNELNPTVEKKLYQFLSLIKVPALSLYVNINNHPAFELFAKQAIFLKDLYLERQRCIITLPASIERLVILDQSAVLNEIHLPKLKSLTLNGIKTTSFILDHARIESLTIMNVVDDSALNSLCDSNNDQLLELSLGQTSDNIDTRRLRSCLMALKPQLRKFAFASTFALKGFWNDFAAEFLQDNAVLKDFSVKYDLQDERIVSTDVSFLIGTYNQLTLTKFTISGHLQSAILVNTALFISKQTSLTSINIVSSIEINNISYLETIFEKVSEIKSVEELNLTYGVKRMEYAIEEYMKEFIEMCEILERRSLMLNGVSIENVKRDLRLDEPVVWKYIQSDDEEGKLVLLIIAAKEQQYKF